MSGGGPDQCLAAEPHHPNGTLDDTSIERWIQSALNLLIGSGLAIDGVMRGPTVGAVRAFQKRGPELAGQRLAVDGIAGQATIGALEKSTGRDAPSKTEAQVVAEASTEPTATIDAASNESPPEGVNTDGESNAQVEQELKTEIVATAAQARKTPNKAIDDVNEAYNQARTWTMGQHDTPTTKRAVETRGRLGKKWNELRVEYDAWVERGKPIPASKSKKTLRDPGTKENYVRAEWFKGYWSLWCYQFADKVASYLHGRRTTLPILVALTEAAAKDGGDGSSVKGRTTLHRGKTLAAMESAEKAAPQLEPGALVHVKLHHEGNSPYEFINDFHHWVVWSGNGTFSDTLTGQNTSGKANDTKLKAWVRQSFKLKDYKFMHDDPAYSTGRNSKNEPLPKAGLQPRITTEYDTRQNPAQKEG